MVTEELFLDTLPCIPIFNSEERMRWLVFRGEDQSHVEAVPRLSNYFDLGEREALDAQNAERLINITEPGPGEFVRCGPCGQNAVAWISHRQESAGLGMHHDVVAVGQIVFERESIRRIAEQARNKCN